MSTARGLVWRHKGRRNRMECTDRRIRLCLESICCSASLAMALGILQHNLCQNGYCTAQHTGSSSPSSVLFSRMLPSKSCGRSSSWATLRAAASRLRDSCDYTKTHDLQSAPRRFSPANQDGNWVRYVITHCQRVPRHGGSCGVLPWGCMP